MEKERKAFEKFGFLNDPNDKVIMKGKNLILSINKIRTNIKNMREQERRIIYWIGAAFFFGYHSRDEEIANLKAQIQRKDAALEMAIEETKDVNRVFGDSNENCKILTVLQQALSEEKEKENETS